MEVEQAPAQRGSYDLSTARALRIAQVSTLVFGNGVRQECVKDLATRGIRRVMLVTAPPIRSHADEALRQLQAAGMEVAVFDDIQCEPTVDTAGRALAALRDCRAESVVGMGGGSVLDVAKLVAALHGSSQKVGEVFGIGRIRGRNVHLACLPTTSGTGSEVSPNSILFDGAAGCKQGIVSPFLVPDAAYVDPALTLTVPPGVTASTGMDALAHCIEAFTNRYAHPVIDLYALEGIRLIASALVRAVRDGADLEARTMLSLGSLYGGLCLGPVNTTAVHALAYPLGSRFGMPHGVSNALLLHHVMEFNLPAAPHKYSQMAVAMGAADEGPEHAVQRVRELARMCGLNKGLAEFGVPPDAIEPMATTALGITRLMGNNPREMTRDDARAIYRKAYETWE